MEIDPDKSGWNTSDKGMDRPYFTERSGVYFNCISRSVFQLCVFRV